MSDAGKPAVALSWDDDSWAGTMPRGVWAGADVRYVADDRRRRPARVRSTLAVSVRPVRERPPSPPQPAQLAAIAYHRDHDAAIMATVLTAILAYYAGERGSWVAVLGRELAHLARPVRSTRGLRSLVRLTRLHVMTHARDDLAYVGLEFACSWDDEHGLGVMTHGNRVLAIGDASTAWDEWRCRDDGSTEIIAPPAPAWSPDHAGQAGIELVVDDSALELASSLPQPAAGVPAEGIDLPSDDGGD